MCIHYACVEKSFDIWDLVETSDDYDYIVRNNPWCCETQKLLFIPFQTIEELNAIKDSIDHVNVSNIYNGFATLNGLQASVRKQYIDELKDRYNCNDETIANFFSGLTFKF